MKSIARLTTFFCVFRCVDEYGIRVDGKLVTNKTNCLHQGYDWVNSNINFDNVFNAMVALFQVVS